MKTLKFMIDEGCDYCKETLKHLNKLHKQHKKYYGTRNIKNGNFIKGILIRPDYNASGHLTHWHIYIEKKELIKK